MYAIKCRFKETIVVPYVAIKENIRFLNDNEDRVVMTADGVRCSVERLETKHICELEQELKDIYNVNPWNYIKKWYELEKIDSLYLLKIKLRKL